MKMLQVTKGPFKYAIELRAFDHTQGRVKCFDSGLTHTYEGEIYFSGDPKTIMVGTDEILVEYIEAIFWE